MAETFDNHYEEIVDKKNEIQKEEVNKLRSPEKKTAADRNGEISTALAQNRLKPHEILQKFYWNQLHISGEQLNTTDVTHWLPEIFSRMQEGQYAYLNNISDQHLATLLQNTAKKATKNWAHPRLILPTIECSKEKDNFAQLSDLLADAAEQWYHLDLRSLHGKKIAGKYYDAKSKKYWPEVYSTQNSGEKNSHKEHVIKSTDYALWEKVLEKSPNKKIAINALASNGSTLLEDPLSGNMILLNNEKGVAEFFDKGNPQQLAALNKHQQDYLRSTPNTDLANIN